MNDLQPIVQLPADGSALLIAGPCSAETEEQVLATARPLARGGVRIFRAGLWKPRTKPGGFEGVGAAGLPWLARVRRETGMLVATEVATPDHVAAALDAGIDMLWLGARTATDPFAVQELADALRGRDVPVLVKNPLSPDLELWLGALERLHDAGLRRLGAIHRGFGSLDRGTYRNAPLWSVPIELRRRLPQLPLLCDPSHIGGRRSLVEPIGRRAMELGFDGLVIEAHCSPDEAWSDRAQQLTPEQVLHLAAGLAPRRGNATAEQLEALRREIDRCDDRLVGILARRMEVARAIGRWKRSHAMPVLQARRYDELLTRRAAQAEEAGMSADFMRELMRVIHGESVRQQLEECGEGTTADGKR